MTPSSPRRIAFDILLRIEKERSYADILIDQALSRGALQGPDRGLLTELVYGVLRQRGTLDHTIDRCATQKSGRLERVVLVLLRLGAYQLLFLDRVPAPAAVHETVELAKTLAPRASGFINAVLRRIDRERDTIPFPDPDREPANYLAARHSLPLWLAARWIDQLGFGEASALGQAMTTVPPFTIRVNTCRIDRESLVARLAAEGVTAVPTRYAPHGLHLATPSALAHLQSFREGLFSVQDESSQLAALLLAPAAGERVLDLCAAPGGKSTYLAELMADRGTVTACDVAPRKLGLIEENARRMGLSGIETLALDASRPITLFPGRSFDRILADAPCSGLGVLRRNPEGKWWKRPGDITGLAATQRVILRNAAPLLKPGGVLVYGVCSPDREENEAVIDDFLSENPDFVLENVRESLPALTDLATERGCFRSWPHRHGMDGFFAARFRKIEESP